MGLINVSDLTELRIAPGIIARAISAQTVTVLHFKITAGAELPKYSHYHEQILNVNQRASELEVVGDQFTLEPGTSFELPPNRYRRDMQLQREEDAGCEV